MTTILLLCTVTTNCRTVNVKLHTYPGRLVGEANGKTEERARAAAVKQAKRVLDGFKYKIITRKGA